MIASSRNSSTQAAGRPGGKVEFCPADPALGSRWVLGLLGVVFLIGLTVRVVYLAQAAHSPDFESPVLDPQFNDYWARALVAGDWTPPPGADDPKIPAHPYGRPPAYPFLLAFVYWIAGGSYLAPRLLQMAVGLLNVWLLFGLARRMFGERVALVSAAFMALYWTFIYFEGELNAPVFIVCASLLLLRNLWEWHERPSVARALGAGALLGVLAVFRPNALLLTPLFALWMVLSGRGRLASTRATLGHAAAYALCCALVIAPAIVRNYAVDGGLVLVSSYGGINAYIGNNPSARGVSAEVPDLEEIAGLNTWNCFSYPLLVRGVARSLGTEDLSHSEVSQYFYGRAASFVTGHPLQALRITLRKAFLFWGPREISDSKVVHFERANSSLLRWLPGFPFALSLFLAGLLLLFFGPANGALASRRKAKQGAVLLLLFVTGYFVSVLPFFISGRYRVPVIPCMLLIGAWGLCEVVRQVRQGKPRRIAGMLLLVAGCAALANIQFVPYQPSRSTWHFHRAISWAATGNREASLEELREALRLDPENAEAYVRLGFMLGEQGSVDEAVRHYTHALEITPNHILAHNNLGYELAQRGDAAAAEEHYRAALAVNPDFVLARNNLGNLLLGQGRSEEAIQEFLRAIAANPKSPHAYYNLGNVLAGQQRHEEAAAQFRKALERNPNSADILNNLGLALAQKRLFTEAQRYYEEALQKNSNHAKAHFNLGNIFGDQGNLDKAITHFEKALECDPAFVQAEKHLALVRAEKAKAQTAPADAPR